MPATKWDSSLIADKCVLLEYSVDPNDAQNQTIVRGYRGLSYASAATIKTALDAEKTVTDPVIDGVTFSGTWRVGTARIVRTESGPLAGSHEVQQNMKYGLNQACMSVVNERLVRSRSYPIEQNENAWMYYELIQSEKTKKWVGLSYAAAVSEYEYLWQCVYASDLSNTDVNVVREHQIIFVDSDYTNHVGGLKMKLHYQDDLLPTFHATLPYASYRIPPKVMTEIREDNVGKYYIVEVELQKQYTAWDDYEGEIQVIGYVDEGYIPVLTEITNPTFETWYEEESDGSYTMYRTLKETTAKPIKKYRKLQYAGMARVWNLPMVGDSTVTIYGITDPSTVIYAYTKFRIGNDVYRVKSDCSSSTDGGTTIWTVSITPEITEETEDLIDAGESKETQVYFEAL